MCCITRRRNKVAFTSTTRTGTTTTTTRIMMISRFQWIGIILLLHTGLMWNSCTAQRHVQQKQQQQQQQVRTNNKRRLLLKNQQQQQQNQQQRKLQGGGIGGIGDDQRISVNLGGGMNPSPGGVILGSLTKQLEDRTTSNSNSNKNDNSGQQQQQQQQRKNTITFHVGPMKTGTSSLQGLLANERESLEVDHYETIATFLRQDREANVEDFVVCFMPDHPSCSHFLNTSVYEVGSVRKNNFVMTAEGFFHPANNIEWMKNFVTAGWDSHQIVMTYRRFYDWLLSFHNQSNKIRDNPTKRVSIVDYVTRWYNLKRENERSMLDDYYILYELERYSEHFDRTKDIQVINLAGLQHQNQTLEEHFICDLLPEASNSCTHYRKAQAFEKQGEPKKKNTHHSLVYEELAYYARENNLWSNRDEVNTEPLQTKDSVLTLSIVTALTRQRHEVLLGKKEYEFDHPYVDCISEPMYEYLEQYTLNVEKELFSDYYYTHGENEIRHEFKQQENRNKFCHVNAQSIIYYDEEWRAFFRSL